MTQTVLLGDICSRITDGAHWSPGSTEEGFPMASVKDMHDYGFNLNTCRKISKEDYQKLVKDGCRPERDDVLIAKDGSYLKHLFVSDGKDDVALLSSIAILKPNLDLVDPRYLVYYIRNQRDNYDLSQYVSGAAIPRIILKSFARMPIKLPDLETQKNIADVLSALDEKIQVNRKMNETLEQIGQALFKKYFITNSKTEKWNKRELGEFFPVKTGKRDANYSTKDGEYPFFTCAQTASKAPDFSFDAHALLLAGNGDFNLKLYRGKFEAYQRTYVLIPNKDKLVGLLYFLMKIKLSEITGGSRGSVIKFITKGMIENYKFPLPADDELLKMAEAFNQITVNIEENVEQSQTLANLRDNLLPRLISGKIKV